MIIERNTKQKQIIYDALCALDHPTATEVYSYISKEYPTVSRGTVFRVLSAFASSGRVKRVHLTDSDERYDATVSPHYHAHCRICGKVKDVRLPMIASLLDGVKTEGFTCDGCDVEFYGVCEECERNLCVETHENKEGHTHERH